MIFVYIWLPAFRRPSVLLALSAAGQGSLPWVRHESCLDLGRAPPKCFCSSKNGPYTFGRVWQLRKRKMIKPRQTRPQTLSLLPRRAGERRPILPSCALTPTHQRRDPQPKRRGAAPPETPHFSDPYVCVVLLLTLLNVAATATVALCCKGQFSPGGCCYCC